MFSFSVLAVGSCIRQRFYCSRWLQDARGVWDVCLLVVFPRLLDSDTHQPFSSLSPDMCTYTTAEQHLRREPAFSQTPPEPLRKLEGGTFKHPMHGRTENLMQTICAFCYRKMQSW